MKNNGVWYSTPLIIDMFSDSLILLARMFCSQVLDFYLARNVREEGFVCFLRVTKLLGSEKEAQAAKLLRKFLTIPVGIGL